jgi:hypothetical protein
LSYKYADVFSAGPQWTTTGMLALEELVPFWQVSVKL